MIVSGIYSYVDYIFNHTSYYRDINMSVKSIALCKDSVPKSLLFMQA